MNTAPLSEVLTQHVGGRLAVPGASASVQVKVVMYSGSGIKECLEDLQKRGDGVGAWSRTIGPSTTSSIRWLFPRETSRASDLCSPVPPHGLRWVCWQVPLSEYSQEMSIVVTPEWLVMRCGFRRECGSLSDCYRRRLVMS